MTDRTASVRSALRGEVAVVTESSQDVPFAEGFDLEALQAVDDDPFFVTVVVREGEGDQGAGPYYDSSVLESITQQINTKRPPGYRGHQDPDKVSWEYREPVTVWVGAQHVVGSDGRAELRAKGYVPTTASDLRTQLKLAESGAAAVNSVSVWGMRTEDGDRVTDFDLWSLDWTPKGRAGMETELVGVSGEQANKEDKVNRDEVIASLSAEDVPSHIAESLREEGRSSLAADVKIAGEMRVIFELEDGDADAVIDAVKGLVGKSNTDAFTERVDAAVGEQVEVDLAKDAVRDAVLGSLSHKATDEEITGEITSVLERPYIDALVTGSAIPNIQGGAGGTSEEGRQATAWK